MKTHAEKTYTRALQWNIRFTTTTGLMVRSGLEGEFTDSSIERTPDGDLHINGYVWSSLLRRALLRLEGGDSIACGIGKYDSVERGVSPLWTEPSFVEMPEPNVQPGNRIDRRYGSAAKGALFSDETVPPGVPLDLSFTYFLTIEDDAGEIKKLFAAALRVVDSGIENIGGGWSYGLGRLKLEKEQVFCRKLNLTDQKDREVLWCGDNSGYTEMSYSTPVKILQPWKKYTINARIPEGQLMAVNTKIPLFAAYKKYPEYPDTFVYKRFRMNGGKPEAEAVLPGRTIRQALLVSPLERKLRTIKPDKICGSIAALCGCADCKTHRANDRSKSDKDSPNCSCLRCNWFGSTDKGGIIAVTEAVINGKDNTEIIHRIQLCEHSKQNNNLFSGEYLTKGDFTFDIFIDYSLPEKMPDRLSGEIEGLLKEMMKSDNIPPGWHRIGATSTCTGQVEITGGVKGVLYAEI